MRDVMLEAVLGLWAWAVEKNKLSWIEKLAMHRALISSGTARRACWLGGPAVGALLIPRHIRGRILTHLIAAVMGTVRVSNLQVQGVGGARIRTCTTWDDCRR